MENQDLAKLKIEREQRPEPRTGKAFSRRLKWIVPSALGAVVLGLLAWSGMLGSPVEVQAMKVTPLFPSKALTVLNASGYVVAQRKAAVSSKATGRLLSLYVEEGKRVKQGDIIAVLENNDLRATLEEARAALRVAKAALKNAEAELQDATLNYDRHKVLRETGAVSTQAFDSAEARFKKAVALTTSGRFGVTRGEASVKVAEVNLDYSLIRAPFDGVILTKNADVGEVVAPFGASVNAKAAVVTMADMDSLMVEVDVAESSLEKVRVGGAAEIKLDAYPRDRFPGRVHMIVPTADRSKATVLAKVKFDRLDERVLPEMSAKVAFLSRSLNPDEETPVLGIPVSSIIDAGGEKTVFRVNDGKAHAAAIKTGRRWDETVEVVSGLKEGDVIVLLPDGKLRDRGRIKVKE